MNESIIYNIDSLTLFMPLKKDPLFCVLKKIACLSDVSHIVLLWSKFVFLCVKENVNSESFFDIVFNKTLQNENLWTLAVERSAETERLNLLAEQDLQKLHNIASLDIIKLAENIAAVLKNDKSEATEEISKNIMAQAKVLCMSSAASKNNFTINYFLKYIKQHGAGVLASGTMFYWCPHKNNLYPASYPDKIMLKDLSGYEDQRNIIISNTQRFLDGRGVSNNLLLYGDRGSGKSATVKAVSNEYAQRRLRLIEVRKNNLNLLPNLIDKLKNRSSLKFIIFIDDLSFEEGGSEFNMLKAYLEGGIETKPKNIVIYATSNRRHLVKEKLIDRPASTGDVRAFDTMQEQLSLADRFGVTVIFASPSQEEYLRIAIFIAKNNGILPQDVTEEQLKEFKENALKWERWFNGRSPRTAVQFVQWTAGGSGYPWEG
ncbi:MAG: ATP-binding protein [Termitinemataceae bacterium]|nr:MAG: ATP-binding protein [Termitinemataceae bacterium]